MRLTWGEIRNRAKAFAADWSDAHYEKGETHSFYNDFFEIFGVKRRQVGSYEKRVQSLDASRRGFIDLFWPGTLIVEQKSAGKDLYAALGQALDYFDWLPERDQPKYVLTCDFQKWRLLDMETCKETRFTLAELPKHVEAFAFILGRRMSFATQAVANIKAAELLGRLHDALEVSGYVGHDLERLLVRLLFCLFADDTGIFEPKDIFLQLIDNDTREDGSDVGRVLNEVFDVLDTPEHGRQDGLSGELMAFPYVNGELFAGHVRTPVFDKPMREMLLDAARFDWGKVSPAIFGSLFQSVMDARERRKKGAHYTSEANILKVIGPLFLDDLKEEFERLRTRRTGREAALLEFQRKLARLTFLDPACGCGNFLVIAYRELRVLELACLEELYPKAMTTTGEERRQGFTDLGLLSMVDVGQFYGIEFEEFPARIAEVAMWMADHLANNDLSAAFSTNYARIPLRDSAHIRHADALETDWNEVIPAERCHYVMGNPPFGGAKYQSDLQRSQVRDIARLGGSGGTLDYVAAWFIKAGQYVQANRRIRIAFVSTNSISQGEQVAQLWPILFDRLGLEIDFAHRTFSWGSEARGGAHVHVVIIGLSHHDNERSEKRLFSYPNIKGQPVETRHSAITAYLFDVTNASSRHLVVKEEGRPINGAPRLITGSQPIDGDIYKFSPAERDSFLEDEPKARGFMQPYIGAEEFINGSTRWILNLGSASPDDLRALPHVIDRIRRVREYRKGSKRSMTRAIADRPEQYGITVIPRRPFLAVPQVSSEQRDYAPIGWLEPPNIPSEKLRLIRDATLWDFGILTSRMHMAWMRAITGRMKSDYMYSVGVVYNPFPWPAASPLQRAKIERLAQAILDARAVHVTSSLADLYDPDTMPGNLRAAHSALDLAVDRIYRPAPFKSDRDRVEYLFGRYEALVNPLEREGAKQNRRVSRRVRSSEGGG
jgi:hypothetical protein